MKEECLICKAPLEYLQEDVLMECSICHKSEFSKTRCVNGHYVCNECHSKGVDSIVGLCLNETSCDPIEIIGKMMDMPFCHMHGPEHHIMVGAALLTAYHNVTGKPGLAGNLEKMVQRGKQVPGGTCGFFGCCGAAVSAGIFAAIVTESTPLAAESWGKANALTGKCLQRIGTVGGPRCCKRDSYLAILAAIDFAAEHLNVHMEKSMPVCTRSGQNNQCIGKRCPFLGGKK